MLKYSPQGKHFAFQPIPYLYKELKLKFKEQTEVYPYALSNITGKTTFQLVKNAPVYSGIKQRDYAVKKPEIEEIEVEVKTIDDVISIKQKIDFIKIDVEGGEFEVLKGAQMTLTKNKPITLFECGKGASDYYGTNPTHIILYHKRRRVKSFYIESLFKQ